jgi:hypothetical protein
LPKAVEEEKIGVCVHFLRVELYTTHLAALSPFPHISKKDKSSLRL